MTDVLNVQKREEKGSTACRRLRARGIIPAVIYGHGEDVVSLSVPEGELSAAVRQGSRLVEIRGDVNDSALLKEIQWDAMGVEILHLDLTRVSADESVEVEVGVHLRGEAPGSKEGGIVEHLIHRIEILCPAAAIPDQLEVNINQLHLNESIVASQVELPDKARLLLDPDAVVVQCSEPMAMAEEEEITEPTEGGEPEVIGRPAEEDDGGSE